MFPGAVAVKTDGSVVFVLEVKGEAVVFRSLTGYTRYRCKVDAIKEVVGCVDLELLDKLTGRTESPDEMPGALKGLKQGDSISVQHRRGVVQATFWDYKKRNYRYPVVYRYKGQLYKTTRKAVSR